MRLVTLTEDVLPGHCTPLSAGFRWWGPGLVGSPMCGYRIFS